MKSKKKMNNKKSMPDFRVLVDRISFNDLLGRYGLLDKMVRKGDQLRGSCPIHQGDNSTSFSVNISKNVYKCFSCGSQGNILDFVVDMQKCSKYQAGCLLEKWFGVLSSAGSSGTTGKSRTVERKESVEKRVQEKKEGSGGEVNGGSSAGKAGDVYMSNDCKDSSTGVSDGVNKPLTFVLKNLDTENEYLLSRVLPATVKVFGLGVCNKGLMADRLVIPIHNKKGELVAYAGRAVDEQTEKADGKYKFPPNFHKGLILFNLHRALEYIKRGEILILVEGFFDVFRLYEMGYLNTVALMGSSMTKEQEALLKKVLKPDSKVALMFDNDEAGINCKDNVISVLSDYCYIKVVNLPEGINQPDQLKEKISF